MIADKIKAVFHLLSLQNYSACVRVGGRVCMCDVGERGVVEEAGEVTVFCVTKPENGKKNHNRQNDYGCKEKLTYM